MSNPYGQNLSYSNYSGHYPHLFPSVSSPDTSTYTSIYPTAPPPLDNDNVPSSPLYPQIDPQLVSIISSPSKIEKSANQAYMDMLPTLNWINNLPHITLDTTSIRLLKDMEQQAKEGIISDCLFVIIKVLDVVRQLGIGLAVGTSLALILCAVLGLPAVGTILSSIVAIPLISISLLGSLACKVTACGLNCLRNEWMNNSFRSMIKTHKSLMLDLKTWIQIKELSQIEKNMQALVGELSNIPFPTVQLHQENQGKISWLNNLLLKIHNFQVIEKNLNMQKSMPIFNQFLNDLKVT